MRWLRRLVLLGSFSASPAWSSELPPAAASYTSVSPGAAVARVSTVGRLRGRLHGGRVATLVGFGLLGAGAVVGTTGGTFNIYDFDGPWWRKDEYDRVYLGRSAASTPLLAAGITMASVGLPMVTTGVLLEMEGLKELGLTRNTVGWAGFGLLLGGAVLVSGSGLFGGVGTIGGPTIAGIGLLLLAVQHGLNQTASRRLPPALWAELYGPRPGTRRVRVGVSPTIESGGGGLALVGAF
jgi:hypothetical protein